MTLGRLLVLLDCDETFARAVVPLLAESLGVTHTSLGAPQLCYTLLKTLAGRDGWCRVAASIV